MPHRLIATALVAWLAACTPSGGEPVLVERWTLTVDELGLGPVELTLPTRLDDVLPPDYRGSFALRARVYLPPSWPADRLSLSIPHQYSALWLAVDGQPHREMSLESRRYYRSRGAHIWPIDPEVAADGSLDLLLSGRRDWWRGGWLDTIPRLAPEPGGDATTRWIDAANRWLAYVCCGMLLAVLFTYLVMFAVVRRGSTYLLYALQSALALVYPLFVLDITRGLGFAELPVLGLSLGFAVVGLVYSANSAFGLRTNRYAWPIAAAAFALVGIATIDPMTSTRVFAPVAVGFLTVVLGHEIWRLGRLARQRPRPTTLMPILLAMVLIAVLAGPDMLPWIGLGDPLGGLRLAPLGLTAYALLHFVAISVELVTSLRRADALNLELEARLGLEESHRGEIEHLNAELRRQVAERSRQLSEALGRLATRADGAHELSDGDIVDERYRVIGPPLGSGAMGTVYRCERLEDGRPLALKVLKTTSDARAMARFAREAQLASGISAPEVVGILDIDFASSGYMYLVMELVEGTSLRSWTNRYGDTPWALAILRQVAEGLASIHRHGVVHRDLKPANVLLTARDGDELRAKITDFGISGLTEEPELDATVRTASLRQKPRGDAGNSEGATSAPGRSGEGDSSATQVDPHAGTELSPAPEVIGLAGGDRSLTQTGWILGTPLYMAPELGEGSERATAASDVFSLGVMAYEMLTGKRPFGKPRAADDRPIDEREPPAPIRARNTSVGEEAERIVLAALSDHPDRRPTARDFADAMARALSDAARLDAEGVAPSR